MQDKHPDDHDRGCEGRSYTCTCGYDDRVEAALATLRQRAEQAESECLEQARLLGMSGERELALRAKIEQAEAEVARLKQVLAQADATQRWLNENPSNPATRLACMPEPELIDLRAKIAAMQDGRRTTTITGGTNQC